MDHTIWEETVSHFLVVLVCIILGHIVYSSSTLEVFCSCLSLRLFLCINQVKVWGGSLTSSTNVVLMLNFIPWVLVLTSRLRCNAMSSHALRIAQVLKGTWTPVPNKKKNQNKKVVIDSLLS